MNYYQIRDQDISNGPGIRVSLFVSGCNINCPGCFNKELQDFNAGKHFGNNEVSQITDLLLSPYINGITILGGEPTLADEDGIYHLIRVMQNAHSLDKSVWLFTGRKLHDNIFSSPQEYLPWVKLIYSADIVVDGPFIEALKDQNLRFRGSSNQRFIDVKESLNKGESVILKENKV